MSGNREYKSDVFCMLLEEPKNALEIYNGLNDSHYTDVKIVERKVLEKGISLSVRNDAAFIVGSDLNLYEHQLCKVLHHLCKKSLSCALFLHNLRFFSLHNSIILITGTIFNSFQKVRCLWNYQMLLRLQKNFLLF